MPLTRRLIEASLLSSSRRNFDGPILRFLWRGASQISIARCSHVFMVGFSLAGVPPFNPVIPIGESLDRDFFLSVLPSREKSIETVGAHQSVDRPRRFELH